MFVPAPKLNGNGENRQYLTIHRGDGGGVFSTISAAASGPFGDAPITGTAVKGYSQRQYGTSGRVNGKLRPTKYFTRRVNVEVKRGLKWVVQIPPSGGTPTTYRNRYREMGTGYIGGSATGINYPEALFARNSTNNLPAAVANRAIGVNLENRCLAEALNKVREQKFDTSETLVGLKQSVFMVLERSAQLLLAYRQARRADWKGSLKTLGIWDSRRKWKLPSTKDAANFWLELQFGWLPLMNDIHAGVNLVNQGLENPKSTLSVVRRLEQSLPFSQWTGTNEAYDWTKRSVKLDAKASVEVRYRFRVSDPFLHELVTLGVDNPAYIVWVAVPWSFLVDWLLPVGDWLQALTAPLGLTFVDGYMSSRRSGVVDVFGEEFGNMHDPAFPTVWRSSKSAWTRVSMVELDRTPYSSWPRPSPYFRLPSMSTTRAINAVALLRQQIGKAPR